MSAISHSSFLLAGDANDVVHSAILQRLVDLRLGEGGVGAERQSLAFSLLALDLGHQQGPSNPLRGLHTFGRGALHGLYS